MSIPEGSFGTIADVRRRLDSRSSSVGDVIAEATEEILELDPHIRAWVDFDPDFAVEQAREQARVGDSGRPLWGVPVGVKDIIDVAGLPTRSGLSGGRDLPVVALDADVVASLRRSGAVLLGKTQASEYAWFSPTETRNPRMAGRSPGGSSSGSAAAVAARMCPVALGTQTAGSIIRPAAFCGIAAAKPTHGLLSMAGVVPVAPSLDVVGVMGNRVADVALVLETLTYAGQPTGLRENLKISKRPRIGVLRDDFWSHADPDMLAAADEAVERLADAGAEIVDVRTGIDFAAAEACHETIMLVEMAYHRRAVVEQAPETLSASLLDGIRRGSQMGRQAYHQARGEQLQLRSLLNEALRPLDAILTPGSKTVATPMDDTGDPAFHKPFTLAGLPAALVPSRYNDEGLPVGVQLVGGWCRDDTVLATARWCEQTLEFDPSPRFVNHG